MSEKNITSSILNFESHARNKDTSRKEKKILHRSNHVTVSRVNPCVLEVTKVWNLSNSIDVYRRILVLVVVIWITKQ